MPNAMLLVACGDATRRDEFVRLLSEAGWENVLSASSMAEAAGLLRGTSWACAIVDSELADVPGLKAVPILQGLCPDAKIIFTAPENTRELETQVRALDILYYYISSGDPAELAAAVEDAIGAPRPVRARRHPRILVVDDDRDFHALVRALLEGAGYEVTSAHSEREGLDAARREKPDIILLDIIMESTTDGFVFCHEARRDPHIKHIPILGVSAIERRMALRSTPGEERGLFPVDGYLRKPLVREQLLAELERLVPERRDDHDEPEQQRGSAPASAPSAGGG